MKLYRCDLCGRVFHERIPHICIHGNYRKRHLTFTEFDDVDNEYIKKSDFDVKENDFPNIPQGSLILNEPLKYNMEWQVNYEQARVDAAISAMNGIIANRGMVAAMLLNPNPKGFEYQVARGAVQYADSLIAELQRVPTQETKQE